jgi:hypothetical protein
LLNLLIEFAASRATNSALTSAFAVVLTDRCANRDVIVKHPATLSLRLP